MTYMAENQIKIPKRILSSLISSLTAGVVPRVGAPYIAIGRTDEVASLCGGLETVSEGGAFARFVVGKYGSGKSFLIQLIRGYACERGFVCADADLSPERRLASSGGGGCATYRELIKNLSTKSSDGGALGQIISRWLSDLQMQTAEEGISPEDSLFNAEVSKKIYTHLRKIRGNIGAFDFSRVIGEYYRGYTEDSDELCEKCMRWLCGEYKTKTEARADLGVSGIISDDNWYEYIKLLAAFVREIGYKGLIIFIDECVNLYKIPNRVSRENNYEKILAIYNDTMQGKAEGLGVIFAGTPQFLEDSRRGLYSYEALRSRLSDSVFACSKDFAGISPGSPVIRLPQLSDDELLALLARITVLYGQLYGELSVTPEDMKAFLYKMMSRVGAQSNLTPRELIRSYLTFLGILASNPDARPSDVLGDVPVPESEKPSNDLDPDSIEI